MAADESKKQQQALPAASTAQRLKYADPRTLPSFPSSGLAPNGTAAGAAATLGWSNQKKVGPWKPDKTSSASAAAALANDYQMSPSWEPAASSDGYRAAALAVGSAGAALKQSRPKSSSHPQETWGNSAATQAFHANRPASAEPTKLSGGSLAATQAFNINRSRSLRKAERSAAPLEDKSLIAARGAMSSAGVKDAHAAEAAAASSALEGAARAHRASMRVKAPLEDVGAVPITTMTRNMFTANPLVKPEVEERSYNEKLHQSAVEMAKKMYQLQQHKAADEAKKAPEEQLEAAQPNPYIHLQAAASKLAQERLTKLHDEHLQGREFQEYYGNDKSPMHRFAVAAKLRRPSSEGDGLDDHQRSQRIRDQMSMFSSQLSQVDREKRERDREALMATAQRNVKVRLQGMDEKLYQETGRANPAMLTEWEVKAQQAAQSQHDSRAEKKGSVDLGSGTFMSAEEVDAIASKRVQPVLDDIKSKAEAERERQAALRIEEEVRREEAEKQKTRERDLKEVSKMIKEQEKQEEKAKKLQEKREERARKEEEKAAKAEEKRQAKEEKRKSKQWVAVMSHDHDEECAAVDEDAARDDQVQTASLSGSHPTVEAHAESPGAAQRQPDMATLPTSKVKGWIRSRFSRRKSESEKGEKKRGFLGGAAMKELGPNNTSTTSLENGSTSMRDVAMAGKAEAAETNRDSEWAGRDPEGDSRAVSPLSTPLEEEKQLGDDVGDEEGRDSRKMDMEPPPPMEDPVARTSSSPTRDSRFREIMDR